MYIVVHIINPCFGLTFFYKFFINFSVTNRRHIDDDCSLLVKIKHVKINTTRICFTD